MIGYCALLLALAAVPGGDGSERTLPAAAGDDGPAYHEQVRHAIGEVLGRREFADLHSDPYAFWRMILGWIAALFQTVGTVLKGMPEWLLWTLLVWMLVTLLAILAHLVYTLVMLLRGASLPPRNNLKGGGIAGELLGIRDLDFDNVYAEARRLLAANDWPAATRYFYVAAILWLDRQGWIVFKRWKTNRDYVDELAPRTRLHGSFRQLTAAFEPIVYGGLPPQSSTIHDIATTVESLLHEPAGASAS